MAVIACPRCQQALQVPKPAPDFVRCGKCGCTIKNSARHPHATPAPDAVSTVDQLKGSSVPALPTAAIAPGAPAGLPAATSVAVRAGLPVASFAAGTQAGSALKEPDLAKKGHRRRNLGIAAGCLLVAGVCLWLLLRSRSDGEVDITIPSDSGSVQRVLDPRVKKSVAEGVAFLRKHFQAITAPKAPPPRMGEVGLIGVTLLECGVKPDDEDMEKLTEIVRKNVPQIVTTYDASPVIFFLDRLHKGRTMPEDDRKRIETLALRLIKGQSRPLNMWSYNIPVLAPKEEESLLAKLREKSDKYETSGGGADLSNTQFAALALWTSRKSGVPVDIALRDAAVTARKYQDAKAGTWTYSVTGGPQFRDTGTCVGLILLALGRAVSDTKETKEFLEDPAVEKSLQHLGNKVNGNVAAYEKTKPAKRPMVGADAHGDYYFLWTLERTCLILGLKSLGDHDWHRWGTEILLDHQEKDGHWQGPTGAGPDTCFALLFLVQANLFQDLTDKLRLGMTATTAPPTVQPADRR